MLTLSSKAFKRDRTKFYNGCHFLYNKYIWYTIVISRVECQSIQSVQFLILFDHM